MADQNDDRSGQTDQSSWVQSADPRHGNVGPQQGGAIRQDQWQANPGQTGQTGQDPLDKPLDAVRQQIESQIHQAIDQYANRLPGGSLVAGSAKQAASHILDNLERQADSQIDSRLSNVPGVGGAFQGNQSNEGGQL